MSETVRKEVYDELMELAGRVQLRSAELAAEGKEEDSKRAAALVWMIKVWAEEWK
uniref:Uncharacterized protein n=1 Tax=viral metagenome TaxID=1070528 RepID=A0A6H2A562_9ZZZZ